MSNGHPQGESVAPRVMEPQQCPSCPPGNSLPIVPNEKTCWGHGWWQAHNYSWSE
jgi:hypothetical protein